MAAQPVAAARGAAASSVWAALVLIYTWCVAKVGVRVGYTIMALCLTVFHPYAILCLDTLRAFSLDLEAAILAQRNKS